MDEETIHQLRINNQRYDDLVEEMVKNKRTLGLANIKVSGTLILMLKNKRTLGWFSGNLILESMVKYKNKITCD